MRCDHCGKEIDRDSEFCKFCGGVAIKSPPKEEEIESPNVPKPKSDSSKAMWLVVLVVPIAFFLFFSFWSDDSSYTYKGGIVKASQSTPVSESPRAFSSSSPASDKESELISYAEYTKIETGMTYDEVCKIVGSYGYEVARTEMAGYQTVIVGWEGEGTVGTNANVTFQNGKVIAKAQAGLQ